MLIVCDKYKFVYCQIPKNACSAIKKWILELEGDAKVRTLQGYALLRYIHSYKYKTITPKQYKTDPKYKQYTLFTIVRNPYLRLVSAFKDRFIKAYKNEPATTWKTIANSITHTPYINFEQFVNYIQPSHTDRYKGNGHWQLQTILTAADSLQYDLILEFESLESNILQLYQKLSIPQKYQNLAILNPTGYDKDTPNAHLTSTKTLDYHTHWKCMYTPNLQHKVYNKYKSDFIKFGYSFELPS